MRNLLTVLTIILTVLVAIPAQAGDAIKEPRAATRLRLPKAKSPTRTISHDADVDQLFDELEALEAPELENHKAGDLTNNQVIIVVLCLIIFFPLGIILLIIFLLDDDD